MAAAEGVGMEGASLEGFESAFRGELARIVKAGEFGVRVRLASDILTVYDLDRLGVSE